MWQPMLKHSILLLITTCSSVVICSEPPIQHDSIDQAALMNTPFKMGGSINYTLPALPYTYDALEPHISAQIMTLHHTAHHQTYVTTLNTLLPAYRAAGNESTAALVTNLRFHAGGHLNHALFWPSLAPPSSPRTQIRTVAPKLLNALIDHWSSYEFFVHTFSMALLGIKGSGWGWLVVDAKGTLGIVTTKDQEIVERGWRPLLGVDMWEHAYYLLYLNEKKRYVEAVWEIVDWETVEGRFVDGEWWQEWGELTALFD